MKLKIEKVAVKSSRRDFDMESFVTTACELQIGESFVFPDCSSYHRMALVVLKLALNRNFVSRKVDGGLRVGRTR